MRQLKNKFKIKRFNKNKTKKRRIRNKMFPILLSLLIVSVSTATTKAYFNSKLSFEDLFNGKSSDLNITNGMINLNFDSSNSSWEVSDSQISKFTYENGVSSIDGTNGGEVTYGPVLLTSNNNLTTNVNLSVDFLLKKFGGSSNGEKSEEEVTIESKVKPFESIVGDIDNFNYGFQSINTVYSGTIDNRFQRETSDNGLRVLPQAYDAKGTDRRMVPSGFYNYVKTLLGTSASELGVSNVGDILKNKVTIQYKNGAGAWIDGFSTNSLYYQFLDYSNNYLKDSSVKRDDFVTYYDGYADRSLRGIYGKDGNVSDESDTYYDSKNWRFIQKAEPITFKYAKISNEQKFSNICLQIYFDDLQSKEALNKNSYGSNHFSFSSNSKFNIYISDDGINFKKVSELAQSINSFAQSGPSGNLITVAIPLTEEYLSIIRNASGLEKGLQVLVDDDRFGVDGDTYCIDFAKLTVNSEASVTSTIQASGLVLNSSNKPIEGITVTSGDGRRTTTDKDGRYSFGVAPGVVVLSYSGKGKVDGEERYYKSISQTVNGYQNTDFTADTIKLEELPYTPSEIYNEGAKVAVDIVIEEFANEDIFNNSSNISIDNAKTTTVTDSENSNISTKYEYNSDKTYTKVTTTYDNLTAVDTLVRKAQCNVGLSPGYKYKMSYVLKYKSADDIKEKKAMSLAFKSFLKAKATQENNVGWNADGTGNSYQNYFYDETYTESSSGSGSGSSSGGIVTNPIIIETDDGILQSDSTDDTQIYFEVPSHSSNVNEDQCGENWWGTGNPNIFVDSREISDVKNVKAINPYYSAELRTTQWYIGTTPNSLDNSVINVKGSSPPILDKNNVPSGYKRIIVKTDYATPHIHAWIDGGADLVQSKPMNYVGKSGGFNVYYYDVPDSATNMILKNKAGWDGDIGRYEVSIKDLSSGSVNAYRLQGAQSGSSPISINELGLGSSSGDLYYFSTKRVFICTN